MNKKEDNFLDLIPERDCNWGTADDGRIYLQVPRFRNRWMKKISRRLGKSEVVKVYFDEIGSRAWSLIDGTSSIAQIGEKMEEEMKEKVEPVYQRLSEFFSILARNKFIRFKNL